jgi:hypothetical protein
MTTRENRMRIAALACLCLPVGSAMGQTATVTGQVVARDGGQPLGFIGVSALPGGKQSLSADDGTFSLTVPAGEVHLRFKRVGYATRDTVLKAGSGEAVRLTVDLARLVIPLPPEMLETPKCTDREPLEPREGYMAALFDQLVQNGERMRMLVAQKPFTMYALRVTGRRDVENKLVPQHADTVSRRPISPYPYLPRQVVRRVNNDWAVLMPEAKDLADTAFTNSHCFRYAGQGMFGADSVVRIEFEPVPSLAKAEDVRGTFYLRADGYQLAATDLWLSRIPKDWPLEGYSITSRFSEFVAGVPALDEWELVNHYKKPTLPFVEVGQVFNIRWDSVTAKPDTVMRRR